MKIKKANVGFIGLGVMGKSMALNLLKAGITLYVYTRTKASAEKVLEKGAIWCETPAEVAKKTEVVFTIVGYPADVEEVYFGDDGLINAAKKDTLLIDMTTSSPALAKKIYEACKEKGVDALDAPVSGGDIGAKKATLSIMCGGEEKVFKKALPFFEELGKTFTLMGEAGAGQNTKAANQILVAANLFGAVEAIRYAELVDLDPTKVIEAISQGAAGSWQLVNNGKRIIERDFAPGFFIKHFLKDLNIALEVAEKEMLNLPVLSLARNTFNAMSEKGFSEAGTQALYEYYRQYL